MIVRRAACSRVAAQTGCQQWCHHRIFDFNPRIRRGFDFHYLCPVRSHHDRRAPGGGFRHRSGCRRHGKYVGFKQRHDPHHPGSDLPGGWLLRRGKLFTGRASPASLLGEKLGAGMRFAIKDLWEDLAGWFLIGIVLAGLITVVIPPDMFSKYLGAGLPAMLIMLAVGIPLYICATASTPIAAALILKGVSPGAALVFLLAGPATNMASLTVLTGVLGKRATAIYLTSIAVCAVVFGLIVDQVYASLGISAQAVVGTASEIVPRWAGVIGALAILAMSIKPVWNALREHFKPKGPQEESVPEPQQANAEPMPMVTDCCPNCDSSSDSRRQ